MMPVTAVHNLDTTGLYYLRVNEHSSFTSKLATVAFNAGSLL